MDDHTKLLEIALEEARKSPPKPTNFRVGALLLCPSDTTSATEKPSYTGCTGYTLELPGNTHAEQNCFFKALNPPPSAPPDTPPLYARLPPNSILYTTMEPCNRRSEGNKPCVDRILELRDENGNVAITEVYVGVLEPTTFVGLNEGRKRLEDAGVKVVKVECGETMEREILEVAKAGHVQEDDG